MADSKLAGDKKVTEIPPMAKTTGLDARTRSDRKDRAAKEKPPQEAASGSSGPDPVGAPRKLEFEEKTYSPRNPDPSKQNPCDTQPVHQLVAAYGGAMQGQETDEEATQRHNREAEAEEAARKAKYKAEYEARIADADKADAALDAALDDSKKLEATKELMHGSDEATWQLMHGSGEIEPVEITKSNPPADSARPQHHHPNPMRRQVKENRSQPQTQPLKEKRARRPSHQETKRTKTKTWKGERANPAPSHLTFSSKKFTRLSRSSLAGSPTQKNR